MSKEEAIRWVQLVNLALNEEQISFGYVVMLMTRSRHEPTDWREHLPDRLRACKQALQNIIAQIDSLLKLLEVQDER